MVIFILLWLLTDPTRSSGSHFFGYNNAIVDFASWPNLEAIVVSIVSMIVLATVNFRSYPSKSAFFVLCVLLSLPTMCSLIRHRGPRDFGTDHIAGILASWAAIGIFGELIPSVSSIYDWLKRPSDRTLSRYSQGSIPEVASRSTHATLSGLINAWLSIFYLHASHTLYDNLNDM